MIATIDSIIRRFSPNLYEATKIAQVFFNSTFEREYLELPYLRKGLGEGFAVQIGIVSLNKYLGMP